MRLTTLTLLAGVLLGLTGGAAMATNPTSCQHSQQQNQYHCTTPDGTNYTVSNVNSAEAAAAAIATGGAGGQGGAGGNATGGNSSATGGDASSSAAGGSATASNGNQSVNIDNRAPKLTTSIGLGVNVNIPIASGVEFSKTVQYAEFMKANGRLDLAMIALQTSSVGKRVSRNIPDAPTGGTPLCQMTKDGVLQVNKYTNVAECKAYHGVK